MKTSLLIFVVGLIILSSVIFVAIWNSVPKDCDDKCEHERRAIEAGKIVTGSYELENPLCIGGRGMIINEDCEIIGKYDVSTGMPIVENKEQCDMLDGDWNASQNSCDSKYGIGIRK